jgi:hypothetical protein
MLLLRSYTTLNEIIYMYIIILIKQFSNIEEYAKYVLQIYVYIICNHYIHSFLIGKFARKDSNQLELNGNDGICKSGKFSLYLITFSLIRISILIVS